MFGEFRSCIEIWLLIPVVSGEIRSGFGVILVILEILGLFLVILNFFGYFSHFNFFGDILGVWGGFWWFWGYVGHSSDFNGIFVKISLTKKYLFYSWELPKYQISFWYSKTSKMTKIPLELPNWLKCTTNVQNIPKT